jgi:hypothetical protein
VIPSVMEQRPCGREEGDVDVRLCCPSTRMADVAGAMESVDLVSEVM